MTGPATQPAQNPNGVGSATPQQVPRQMSRRTFYLLVLVVAVVIAGGLSLLASSAPDGLEWTAQTTGFGQAAQESAVSGTPLADYAVAGRSEPWLRALAGLVGVAITAAFAFGLFALVNRRSARRG